MRLTLVPARGAEIVTLAHPFGKSARADDRGVVFHKHPLHYIAQLTHIARPYIRLQQLDGIGREFFHPALIALAQLLQKRLYQQGNIIQPFTQRRQVDAQHTDTVIQIAAELALSHRLLQPHIGSADYPHIHRLYLL